MRNANGDPRLAWQQQQAMYPYRQNQCGGGHPDANIMAMRQQQQLQYYQQQRAQRIWNPSAHHMYSNVDPSTQSGNFIMPKHLYFGHDGDGVHQYHQHQQQLGPESNRTPYVPQQEGWAQSRPRRTPCKHDWWSYVIAHMRVVDSPRGIDLDVEDDNANMMEELRQTKAEAGTDMNEDTETVEPACVGTFERAKRAGAPPEPTPTLDLGFSCATEACGGGQNSAETGRMQESNPYPPYAQSQQTPMQAQASLPSGEKGVPITRQQKPQEHLSGDRGGVIESRLGQEAISDAEGNEGEKETRKQIHSTQPHIANKDNAGSIEGVQQKHGTVVLNSTSASHCNIGETRELLKFPQNPSKSACHPHHLRNRYFYTVYRGDTDKDQGKDDGEYNNSDESSGDRDSDSHSHSDSDSDSDDSDGSSSSSFDSDGSDTDNEADYSTMRRNSQSAFGGKSTLEFSTFQVSAMHARTSINPFSNHVEQRHSIAGLLGAAMSTRFQYPESSAYSVPSDDPAISILDQLQHPTAVHARARDVAMSSFSLCHSEAHALPVNALFAAGSSVTPRNTSTTTAAEMEDLGKHGYALANLVMAETTHEQANRTAPVGAGTADGVPAPCTSTPLGTAAMQAAMRAVPPLPKRKKEEPAAQPREVAVKSKSASFSVEVPRTRSGTGAVTDAPKTAAAPLPKVNLSSKMERPKGGDATAEPRPTKGASKSPDSRKASIPVDKKENHLPGPLNLQPTPPVKKDHKTVKGGPPVTRVPLATAVKDNRIRDKANGATATTTSERATATATTITAAVAKVPQVPLFPMASIQHVPGKVRKVIRSAHVLKTHSKQKPMTFQRVDKANASLTTVMNQPSAKSHQPPSTAKAAAASPAPAVVTQSLHNAIPKVSTGSDTTTTTTTKQVNSAASSNGTLLGIGSSGNHPHRTAASSKRIKLGEPPQPPPLVPPSKIAGEAAGSLLLMTAAATAVADHHRPQPAPPKNESLINSSNAERALGKKGDVTSASAKPPNEAKGPAHKSSATADARKRLSSALLSNPASLKPTSATGNEAAPPPARDATTDVRRSSSPKAAGTSAATFTMKKVAMPSATKTSPPTTSSPAAKSPVKGVSKNTVVSTSGSKLSHSLPAPPQLNNDAAAPIGKGTFPPLVSKPMTTTAAAPQSTTPVPVNGDSSIPACHNNQQPVTNSDDDEYDAWLDDPYVYYGFGEPDLPDPNSYSSVKPSPQKLAAVHDRAPKNSMVDSMPMSPLNASSLGGKTDAAIGTPVPLLPLGDADTLAEIEYMYNL
ncbi:hypothetical protein, unknown function [Leishmania tarentolae]|uniref:Uncharacterized protein n=1 Tax=Leishmania tarentolae TaxID=5689 RepID=A0A640KGI0_LEITA|nr:hypothetical protein, unknown function [Leishmania tarentolae]